MPFAKKIWPHRFQEELLAKEALTELKDSVLNSPYLAASDLNEGFAGTKGFSLLFRSDQEEKAKSLFPSFAPYLDKVKKKEANAFFLNPLVIHGGGAVRAHADKTLASYLPSAPFPFCVSVLYLSLPTPRSGGQIVFHRWFGRHKLEPKPNLLVEFPGWLKHEVKELKSTSADPRISVVLEQYQLTDEQWEELLPWHLDSEQSFEYFLEQAQQAGSAPL